MPPYEIMLSESQERMLMVIKPGSEPTAREIFQKWGLDFEIIGHVTDTNHLVLKSGTQTVCDIPVPPLVSEAPIYERSWVQPPPPAPLPTSTPADKVPIEDALFRMMSAPDLCSRRWIWEQYDHMVMADTVQRPGGDAAVVRVHGTEKALAITTDCTPRYCVADPFEGGRQTVAEAWRNLISVGARPLAITDNLNFGNPERPEVMGQFVGCIEGMAEACKYLDFPVVSGNVSLYNETNGSAILPTPAIGGVGLIENLGNMTSIVLPQDNHLFLVGHTKGHVGASIWLYEIGGIEAGNPPPVVLEIERKNGEFIHQCIKDGVITACHDISDGGLLVALAEMALAGRCGADITVEPDGIPLPHYCFGEDQGRYLVATRDKIIITEMSKRSGIELTYLGKSGGNTLTVNNRGSISLKSLRDAYEGWFPEYMAG